MSWRLTSTLVIVATPIVVLVYDFVAYRYAGSDGTISRVAISTSEARPWFLVGLCFLLALLCGHLFVPTTSSPSGWEWVHAGVIVLVPLVAVLRDLLTGALTAHPAAAIVLQAEPGAWLARLGDFIRDHRMVCVLASLVSGALVGHRFVPQHLEI